MTDAARIQAGMLCQGAYQRARRARQAALARAEAEMAQIDPGAEDAVERLADIEKRFEPGALGTALRATEDALLAWARDELRHYPIARTALRIFDTPDLAAREEALGIAASLYSRPAQRSPQDTAGGLGAARANSWHASYPACPMAVAARRRVVR